ncbi:MAG: NADH-quinone oxidoreductase subunit C [Thermoleophilia bacterium]|nr:NADH-quinone oxidoreductase subunit C [Thermoleophilia bacterium]
MVIEAAAAYLVETMKILRDDEVFSFKYFNFMGGADYLDHLEAVYLLRSMLHPVMVEIRVRLDRDAPVVPSVTSLWEGANWHEREAYDLFGITFEGHPDPRRILSRPDMDVFPCLKDARPHRKTRAEWKWTALDAPKRLPGEPPRRERS